MHATGNTPPIPIRLLLAISAPAVRPSICHLRWHQWSLPRTMYRYVPLCTAMYRYVPQRRRSTDVRLSVRRSPDRLTVTRTSHKQRLAATLRRITYRQVYRRCINSERAAFLPSRGLGASPRRRACSISTGQVWTNDCLLTTDIRTATDTPASQRRATQRTTGFISNKTTAW